MFCNLKIKDLNQFGKISIIIHLAAIAPLPDNQMNPLNQLKITWQVQLIYWRLVGT